MLMTLRVRSFVTATPRTRILRLALGNHRFDFRAGQAALVGPAGGGSRQPYSIASAPHDVRREAVLEFLIQMDSSGNGVDHWLRGVRHGGEVLVEGPVGGFHLPDALDERQVLFVAGGTGIAPLRSMMRELLAKRRPPRIGLIYCARSTRELVYGPELRRLARDGQISLALVATRDAGPRWSGGRGRVRPEHFTPFLNPSHTECFVCGPPSLVAEVPVMLRALGVPERHVHRDRW
jgi:ferredoxin-NADP reductase